jgi:mono/diheme cytochrome c family protein
MDVAGDSRGPRTTPLCALAMLTLAWLAACAGSPSKDSSTEAHSRHSGEHLYQESCAACHGVGARGNGPVAPILEVPVPDLTLIAARRGGAFSADEIFRIVDGQADLGSHGRRNMPVWGYELFGADADDETAHGEATRKVESVVEFLRSIQRAPGDAATPHP